MLRRLSLRDFVIVDELEVEFGPGFGVLTGETGAGKSILIDALQLALGSRSDAGVVREGAQRAEIGAEFDTPAALLPWLEAGGFETESGSLLLRRSVDAQGRSRAWINGSPATVTQLREAAEHLVDIHGQHAWQSLTRPAAVRSLLDEQAGIDPAPLAAAWAEWRAAGTALDTARQHQAEQARERERLAWQIAELERLAPGPDEWESLNADHRRLSNAQALIDAVQSAVESVADGEQNAQRLISRAAETLRRVADLDPRLADIVDVLDGAEAQLQDAAHGLAGYLHAAELEPERLQALDDRLSAWMGMARRYRRPPAELPALLEGWRAELQALDAASDLELLEARQREARVRYDVLAASAGQARRKAAPPLARAVTAAMQSLGMAGGRFEVELLPQDTPQSYGLESVELLVAGHAGSSPRPLAKVASGGELSRLALAISVTTALHPAGPDTMPSSGAGTLIFDEIDAGVGGTVADTVGRLMRQLGEHRQVLAVTHLPQVAACASRHWRVAKALRGDTTLSTVEAIDGETRTAEIARMLGGDRRTGTGLAHAQELIDGARNAPGPTPTPTPTPAAASRSTRQRP